MAHRPVPSIASRVVLVEGEHVSEVARAISARERQRAGLKRARANGRYPDRRRQRPDRAIRERRHIADGNCRTCGKPRGEDGTNTLCRRHADQQALKTRRWAGLPLNPPEPRLKGQRTQVMVYLTRDEADEWKEFAGQFGMSIAALAREAIREYIDATDEHEDWRRKTIIEETRAIA